MITLEQYAAPEWAAGLSSAPDRVMRLAMRPTPLEKWKLPAADIWIKRDDLTGCALSGNKVRKLEFLLAEASSAGCDTVITCGGIQSNHCRATAVAAREAALMPHVVLSTERPSADPGLEGNLLLDRIVGAEIHLISPDDYLQRDEIMLNLANELKASGRKPYIIPEGGSNALGAWGYLNAWEEIRLQIEESHLGITDVVVACGSGGTAAGLALGAALSESPVRIHAVSVNRVAQYFYTAIGGILKDLGSSQKAEDVMDVIDGYVGEGYARSTDDELRLIAETASSTGIILDPVYTGKAFRGMLTELEKKSSRFRGGKLLFIHTGGMLGLYEKIPQFSEVLAGRRSV